MLSCYHPLARPILLLLGVALLCVLLIFAAKALANSKDIPGPRRHWAAYMLTLGVFALVGMFVLWLSSYAHSPLPFARQPLLRGFVVQVPGRPAQPVPVGGGFSVAHTAAVGITLEIEPEPASCNWKSREGALLDLADQCDIVYAPPDAYLDQLQVSVRSGCGLPNSNSYLNVQVLP